MFGQKKKFRYETWCLFKATINPESLLGRHSYTDYNYFSFIMNP